jgi:predicted transport protein
MKELISCIEKLRSSLERHKKNDLKEYPTRTIFVDPLLEALGWDVRDPDEVELEYPTIDGKSVDYAPKINRKPVLFVEAKPLKDSLTDVKSITQVVGYSANDGVEWCILTNGVKYKVYRSTEKAEAPDKLLFEVSIDPKDSEGLTVQEIAEQFSRFSRDAMAKGVLDDIGEQIFTTGKIRKALDLLLMDPPNTLIRHIRQLLKDDSIKPLQVKNALKRLWGQTSEIEVTVAPQETKSKISQEKIPGKGKEYSENHHLYNKPQEVIELFRALDRFCRELDLNKVHRNYRAKTANYYYEKRIFCSVHLCTSGLRVWLKLKYPELVNPPEYIRDVSHVGHWGVGDVEIRIDSLAKFQDSKAMIQMSFDRSKSQYK